MYWLFKINNSLDIDQFKISNEPFIISIEQKRNFAGKQGDGVILMVDNGKWEFNYLGVIGNVDQGDLEQLKENQKVKRISIINFQTLEEPNKLSDFSYSLKKIYKWYNEPNKHLRRKYNRLEKEDFEIIVQGQIFISRTAFGKIINSLHLQHRVSFLQTFMRDNLKLFVSPVNFVEALTLLKDYIAKNIIPDVIMLKEINDFMNEIDSENSNSISFSNPNESGGGDNISIQSELCKEYLEQDINFTFLTNLLSEISEARELKGDEIRFGSKFRNHQLPISLS